MSHYDCVVLGGGAAGLMCAAAAAKRGKTVAIVDHANKVGKKILMSGGGRCNFTNYFIEPENFLSTNPHFCISALSRFTQYDFLELVQKYDLQFHEKTLGQLFCDHKSKDILQILLAECDANGVLIHTDCRIDALKKIDEDVSSDSTEESVRFHLQTSLGLITCHSVVVATGGLSIPTMGATGLGYDLAKQFGLRVKPRYAALVPFTLKNTAEDPLLTLVQSLAGVSMNVSVACGDQSFSEGLLFTHKGLSGPAVLQISNYWNPGDHIVVDFLPQESLVALFEVWQRDNNKADIKNVLSRYLPKRFVNTWFEHHAPLSALSGKAIAQFSKADIEVVDEYFHRWQCTPAGTEGYKTAEVTKGGVDTDDVSSKTFEAKKVPGLFLVGEVLDVTGWLGGYNFQWAWASGYCAAQYV
jgi:predicted Rossmann fold flavoprotein